ncbi:hypothetical protein [Nocardia carnea]|uniref:hypothetical protein n=1 Tax=Nocardia carnea TaxID=37328 RepID=UPI0024550E86|nr:hypothetical protein [Nocardia carnea]
MSETVLDETETGFFSYVLRLIDAEYDLARDRSALRRQGRIALSFATDEDLELLNHIADIYTTRPPSVASTGLYRTSERKTPHGRHLAALLPPVQPGFAPDDPHRFTNPHLYMTTVRTENEHTEPDVDGTTAAGLSEPATDDTDPAAPAAPWNPHEMLPKISGPAQRKRVNWILARIVDHLSERPYQDACAEIAKLRMLCHPDDLVYFDACVPAADPRLHQPTDPDLRNPDTIARGLDAAEWQIEPVRDRYRPQKQTKARPTAKTGTPKKGAYVEQTARITTHLAKGAARRRADFAAAAAKVDDYFDTRAFLDHEAEQEPYDYLDLRHRIYHYEATREEAKPWKLAEREARRNARRGQVVDAEVARRRWDRVYIDFVSGQLDAASMFTGDRVRCEDYGHRVAEDRTRIRIAADERDPFQANGNNLDYDQPAVAALAGWPCVSCFIERPGTMDRAAMHRIDGRWRSDDGLCESCRADNRDAIPALPSGFTNGDLVEARCAFLVQRYPGSADRILDRIARGLRRHPAVPIIRSYISPDFGKPTLSTVDRDAATSTPKPRRNPKHGPAVGRGQRRGRCRTCRQDKAVHDDDLCTGCRLYLGIIEPPARHVVA